MAAISENAKRSNRQETVNKRRRRKRTRRKTTTTRGRGEDAQQWPNAAPQAQAASSSYSGPPSCGPSLGGRGGAWRCNEGFTGCT
eukprot:5141092-Pyramimonas_sp.AAC.1